MQLCKTITRTVVAKYKNHSFRASSLTGWAGHPQVHKATTHEREREQQHTNIQNGTGNERLSELEYKMEEAHNGGGEEVQSMFVKVKEAVCGQEAGKTRRLG